MGSPDTPRAKCSDVQRTSNGSDPNGSGAELVDEGPTRRAAARADRSPTSSDEALKLAIKLAVDAGEYERAAALLDVAKKTTRAAVVTSLAEERVRRERER